MTVNADNGKKITSGSYIIKVINKKITWKDIFDSNMNPKVKLPLVGIPITPA